MDNTTLTYIVQAFVTVVLIGGTIYGLLQYHKINKDIENL